MPENRFYLNEPFDKKSVYLENEELYHLKVMRTDPGDIVELVNGQNQLAQAELITLDKQRATLNLLDITTSAPPSRQIILALAYLRPKNLDLVIEKGTELGATAFWLFPGERSEKESLTPNQLQRLHTLTISALKQCGRLDLPQIHQHPPLLKWAQLPSCELYFGDLNSQAPFHPTSSSAIFIGPEKGFSPQESQWLCQKAKGIRLNPHILRAETAALCALSLATSI